MRARPLIAILAAALALGACGSDEEGEPIPQETAAAIETQLSNIEGQIADGSVGACDDIKQPGNTFETLESAVQDVPSSVDPDLRDALERSVERLGELVDEECDSLEAETETVPEETETVTIETVPEEPPPVEPPPEEDDEDDENGENVPPGQLEQPVRPGEGPPNGGTGPGGGGTGGGGLPVPGDNG